MASKNDPLCVWAPLREKTIRNPNPSMHQTAYAPLQPLVMVSFVAATAAMAGCDARCGALAKYPSRAFSMWTGPMP